MRTRLAFLESWKERWQAWQKARAKEKERVALDKKLKQDAGGESRPATLITQNVAELKEKGTASAKRVPKEPSPRDMDFSELGPQITEKRIQVEKARVIATGTHDFVFPSCKYASSAGQPGGG